MDCPGCSAEMTEVGGDDEKVRVCPQCAGLSLDVGDLTRVLLHAGLPGVDSLVGKVVPGGAAAVCRECLIDLTRMESRGRHDPAYFETCESCGGVFVEPGGEPAGDLEAAHAAIVALFRRFVAGAVPARGP